MGTVGAKRGQGRLERLSGDKFRRALNILLKDWTLCSRRAEDERKMESDNS